MSEMKPDEKQTAPERIWRGLETGRCSTTQIQGFIEYVRADLARTVEVDVRALAGEIHTLLRVGGPIDQTVAIIQMRLGSAEKPAWRDIETAPRDCTPILAFWTPAAGEKVSITCYAVVWHELGEWLTDDGDTYNEPTHWMPLPKPPVKEEGEN